MIRPKIFQKLTAAENAVPLNHRAARIGATKEGKKMEKIERMKHVSKINGAVTYLEVNHDAGTYTDDYHGAGAGHWDALENPRMTTKGEVLGLIKYYGDVLGYKKV